MKKKIAFDFNCIDDHSSPYCVKSLWCGPVLLAINNEFAWSVVAVWLCEVVCSMPAVDCVFLA